MKKLFGVFVLGMLMLSMSLSFVSAGAVEQIQDGVQDVYSVIEPALKFIVGDTENSPELFMAKILFLIIIFGVVWMALKKVSFFTENEWVLWTVTIAVSLLAIRWFGNEGVINSVILPYSVLGVALTAGLPFVVYFLVVKDLSKTMRKVAWIFFIVIFFSLWVMRSGESGEAVGAVGGPVGAFAWIYLATAGLALIVLLADKTIQRTIKKSAAEANEEIAKSKRRTQIIKQRQELEDAKIDNQVTLRDYDLQDKALKKLEKKYDII